MNIHFLLLFQTPFNSIKFISNEDSSPQFLEYYKFLKFVSQFKIEDFAGFKDNIDKFKTIFLDCSNGVWHIEKPEIKERTFEEMLKLNPGKQEIEEEKKKSDPLLSKKNFLDAFSKARKNNFFKNFNQKF